MPDEPEPQGAFLVYRDAGQRRCIHVLSAGKPVTVGRASGSDLALTWDDGVSRLHARLELVGDDPASDWTVVDDGPSRNGTFVNGKRVRGRARLSDGDRLTFADTAMLFCAAAGPGGDPLPASPGQPADLEPEAPTVVVNVRLTRESLSDAERQVLGALARPVRRSGGTDPPATDEQIARRTHLAVDTVRRTLAALCLRLGLQSLPDEEQRTLLVAHALRSGVINT